MSKLLHQSLHHRFVVLGVALALVILGLYRSADLPVDVFPDLTAPRVTIVTETSGLATEEVEQLVSFPIETSIQGMAGLRRVRSGSAPGISIVWAEFDWGTSSATARQRVIERMQTVSSLLPPQSRAPLLAPATSVMGEILFVALTSDTQSPMDLRRIAEVRVRRRLLAVEGVSQVVAIGGDVKQYQVRVHPERIERFGLTLEQVEGALARGSENAPGGYAVRAGQESVIRILGRAQGVDDLGAIAITLRGDTPIRVRDVATVEIAPAVARGTASYNAQAAVLLSVVKGPESDTVGTTQAVDRALRDLEQELDATGVRIHDDV
ncbi:MAG: efflux RND transporter permease subunit, partial [Myxococcales bacterium]|nr:efflux RND transporter permease subunit [Myxococcales bacterium]